MCGDRGISQSPYDQWRDQFLSNARKAFEIEKISQYQVRLESESSKVWLASQPKQSSSSDEGQSIARNMKFKAECIPANRSLTD